MADLRPFRALRYNLQRVSASNVVTQPYDKITPAMQEKYYAASPYNLVRIILGRREDRDNTVENVYTRAAAFARQWREEGIFAAGLGTLDLFVFADLQSSVGEHL
jgi:uncharacterized protein (DUF1015 family)